MNRTKLAGLALTAAATLTLTACAGSSEGGGTTELEVQTGVAADTSRFAALTELAGEFKAANPGVEINLVPAKPSYDQDIKVRLAARDAPDVFMTHGWSRDRYADFLEPLQGRTWAENLDPSLEDALMDDSGAFFALPMNTSISGVVYNETVLDSVGVDPATLTTWDAFTDAVKKVVASGRAGVVASGKENWTAGNVADVMATGFYTEDQLESLKEGSFDEGTYARVLELIKEWAALGAFNKDYTSATGQDIDTMMASDQAAFAFQSNSLVFSAVELNPDVKLGFIPVPSEVGSPYLAGGEELAYGVSKASPDKEIGLKFLDFLAEPANQGKMADALGSAPGLTNATSDLGIVQASFDKWVTEAGTPVTPFFDRVYLPNGMWNTMVTTADAVIVGQGSPADGAKQMATSFQSLYGQE